jgi:hypothetical protein
MNFPEDIVKEIISFLNLSQMDIEHRFNQLRKAVKRLETFSSKCLYQIGEVKQKIIRMFPAYLRLGIQLSLKKIEVDVSLQTFIMRMIHSDRIDDMERRMLQLQAMYIRRFYKGQDQFPVLWDRRGDYKDQYLSRIITREDFNEHYRCMISHQMTPNIEDWGYKVSGCLNISEEAKHTFCLTI